MQEYLWGAMEMVQVDQDRAERAGENEAERMARVMQLRKSIRAGNYHVSSLDLAERMLESLRWP
jgi:anti-sigma28 factor (negative regulator of flagellin synthesis)